MYNSQDKAWAWDDEEFQDMVNLRGLRLGVVQGMARSLSERLTEQHNVEQKQEISDD